VEKRILIIEDEKEIQDNLRILLETEKYKVIAASNGFEGINKCIDCKPDLIICDIMMNNGDGYDVLNFLDSDKCRLTPFIFLTAKTGYKDYRNGMELGADDYMFKPYDADELLRAIETQIKKYDTIKAGLQNKVNSENDNRNKIFLKTGDHSVPVSIDKIIYISADRQYTNVFVDGEKAFITKKALNKWEEILPKDLFVRIHRSTLINLNYIKRIQKTTGSSYTVYLENIDNTIDMSRRYYKNIKNKNL
jgi:DNA-binding LytR/AlgR family response regulator